MTAEMAARVLDLDGLSAEERLLLLLIADQTDGFDQAEIKPAGLAASTGLPVAAVERFVKSFASAGFYKIEERTPGGFLVTFDTPPLQELMTPRAKERRQALERASRTRAKPIAEGAA